MSDLNSPKMLNWTLAFQPYKVDGRKMEVYKGESSVHFKEVSTPFTVSTNEQGVKIESYDKPTTTYYNTAKGIVTQNESEI